MAIQGTFTADFASFQTAVETSIVQLKGFEASTAKVETSLNRMTDTFSGRKIITEATLMAQAVENVGGISHLTEAELAKVGATAAAAAEKLRAWGQDVPPHIQRLADTVKGAGEAATKSSGFFGDLSGEIVKTAAGFVSAQAVIGVVTGAYHELSQFVGDSVKAFAEAEAADVKLVAALRQHSIATPEVIAQYRALGTTFQQTTKYSDDEIAAMEGLLTQVGGLMPSAMAGALKASTDLAAGLGIDLHSATTLVAKAAAGHTETLGRYGITVSEADLKSKGFVAVLEAVNRQFGGQAAADLDTYAGKLTQIGNSWNNVQEAVGKFIIQNPAAIAAVRELQEATAKGDKATSDASASWVSFAKFIGAGFLAGPIAAVEGLAAAANDVADISKQIANVPSPFAKIVADAGALPPITAGMQLFNEQLVIDAKAAKDAAEAQVKMAAAMIELNSVGGAWQKTIDTVSGSVGEAIKYYLQAGVAQSALMTAYGLTAAQVKAFASELTAEHAAAEKSIALAKQAAEADAKWAAIMAELAAVGNGWLGTLDTIDGEVVEGIKYYLQAGVAQHTLAEAYALTDAQVKAVATSMHASIPVVAEQTKGFDDLAAAAAAASKAMSFSTDISFSNLLDQLHGMITGYTGVGGLAEKTVHGLASGFDADAIALAKQGYSFEQIVYILEHPGAPRPPSPGPRIPGYQAGGDTGEGGLAVTHPHEYVVPEAGALVLRGGGGASVVFQPGSIVIQGSVLAERDLTGRLSASITKAVLQGIQVH